MSLPGSEDLAIRGGERRGKLLGSTRLQSGRSTYNRILRRTSNLDR